MNIIVAILLVYHFPRVGALKLIKLCEVIESFASYSTGLEKIAFSRILMPLRLTLLLN